MITASHFKYRLPDEWIIDFGCDRSEKESALFEAPFQYLASHVKEARLTQKREAYRLRWWIHAEARPGMRAAINRLKRYIVTPLTSKHRVFSWCNANVLPEGTCVAIAREDDCSFGILHSRLHGIWSIKNKGKLEDRPRYTPTTCFETFPFPEGLAPNVPVTQYAGDPRAQAIAAAAKRLNELRENWLNPPGLVRRVPEVVPGYPDRSVPVDEASAKELKKRTLTNLYNQRPAWLDYAHKDLDVEVAAAYGWPADLSDDEILARLFRLNQERAKRNGS